MLSAERCPAPSPACAGGGCHRAGCEVTLRSDSCKGEITAGKALTEELWPAPPSVICGGRRLQRNDFAVTIRCRPSLLHLLRALCRNPIRASSEEALPLPLLRLLVIDRLEIQKKRDVCFVTLLYLLFAKGRAIRQVESLSSVTLLRGALPPVGLREWDSGLKKK